MSVHYKCQCLFYDNVRDDLVTGSKILKTGDTKRLAKVEVSNKQLSLA